MSGTSIEDDHVLINGQTVFGYPTGMQARPLRIALAYPDDWQVRRPTRPMQRKSSTLTVRRGEEEWAITCQKFLKDKIERHVFTVDTGATPEQVALRQAWMRNMGAR